MVGLHPSNSKHIPLRLSRGPKPSPKPSPKSRSHTGATVRMVRGRVGGKHGAPGATFKRTLLVMMATWSLGKQDHKCLRVSRSISLLIWQSLDRACLPRPCPLICARGKSPACPRKQDLSGSPHLWPLTPANCASPSNIPPSQLQAVLQCWCPEDGRTRGRERR